MIDVLFSLVFQCEMWCVSGICHCNSHKRSAFWSNLRNHKLLGGLTAFNLTLSEMDSHLRQAGANNKFMRGDTRDEPLVLYFKYILLMYLFIFTSCPATLLQQFRQDLSALYSSYMKGEALKEYGLSQENQQGFIYKYVS